MARDGLTPSVGPIHGVDKTLAELRKLDANAYRRIQRGMTAAGNQIAGLARTLVDPQGLSGWQRQLPGGKQGNRRRGYDPSDVAAGIKVRKPRQRKYGNERRSFLVVSNTTAAGAIWEVAGRSSRGNTAAGAAMIRSIESRGGQASRTIWAAADQTDMGEIESRVAGLITEASAITQAKINRI